MKKERRLRFSLLRALLCVLAAVAFTPLIALAGFSWENGQIAVAGFSLIAATVFGCVVWAVVDAIATGRFHFGLRTLMAAITLLAVLLALSGRWAMRVRKEAARRSEAIETLSKFGASLYFGVEVVPVDWRGGWVVTNSGLLFPGWIRSPFIDTYLSVLESIDVDLSNRPVSAEDLASIAQAIDRLPHGRGLRVAFNLHSSTIGVPELKQLARVPGLRGLDVGGNGLPDDAIDLFAGMEDLEFLKIERTGLSSAAVDDLLRRRPRMGMMSDCGYRSATTSPSGESNE